MASWVSHCLYILRGKKWIWFEIYTSKLYKKKIKLENGEDKDKVMPVTLYQNRKKKHVCLAGNP